jgi:predicted NAD/FAD-binding protein
VARFSGTIHTEARIASVNRREDGVTVRLASGESVDFDKVVLAAPPDQVLKLLADP